MKAPLEKDIQFAFINLLRKCGFFVIRHNNVKITGKKTFVKMEDYEKGMPDIMTLYRGRWYCIEMKRPGGKLSIFQEQRKIEIDDNGGTYLIISSIKEGVDFINRVKTEYRQRCI